jgi:hypothetical protein
LPLSATFNERAVIKLLIQANRPTVKFKKQASPTGASPDYRVVITGEQRRAARFCVCEANVCWFSPAATLDQILFVVLDNCLPHMGQIGLLK